jgi:4-amino-4-deoxy-L-arabinose transferase-like glycosyltransferase
MKIHMISKAIREHISLIVVIVAAIGFFFFSSTFNYLSQDDSFRKWMSPDETANYTIAKLFAETGTLQFFESYNLISKEIIHPRSFRSDFGWIKPVSFLGLPILFGTLANIFGTGVLPYLTPLFGALGIIFFYLLIKELFGRSVAVWSAIILAVFPVYIYFSARSFFHNILFIVCIIVGSYFAVVMTKKPEFVSGSYIQKNKFQILAALVSGLFFGWGIMTRTSELIWVGPLLLCLYIFNIRQVGIVKLFLFLLGLGISCLPTFYWNQLLYGSWYASGYPALNSSLGTLTENSLALAQTTASGHFWEIRPLLAKIKMTIFHFGYKPDQSLTMFDRYVVSMFPWLFWSSVIGFVLYLIQFKKYTKKRWLFISAWLCCSLIVILYYGSWLFYDNPDPKSFTIGNSYTRYWLPFYLGAILLGSLALVTITSWLRKPWLIVSIRCIVVAIIAVISIRFVWLDPAEGIQVSILKQAAAKVEWQEVLSKTESNSIIITRYHDKVFFPERKVVVGLFDDPNIIREYGNLAERLPVYYYNFTFPEKDLTYLNSGPLFDVGLRLTPLEKITDSFTLYSLKKVYSGPILSL